MLVSSVGLLVALYLLLGEDRAVRGTAAVEHAAIVR
jgi:hypothetical protein